MCSLDTDLQYFLLNLLPQPSPLPEDMQIQCNEDDSRLTL